MKFSYEDLISGDSLYYKGVGHIRQPKLKELKPSGIGYHKYNLYLNCLSWDKQSLVEVFQLTTRVNLSRIVETEKLNTFDAVSLIDSAAKLLQEAMAFFMDETITWEKENRRYVTTDKETGKEIGEINRENFDDVRDSMLQVNYINVSNETKPLRYTSEKAKQLWEEAQKKLKETAKKNKQDKQMALGNIISKLCVASNSYNLFNIYELTVFQLYDQFFQYGYLRAMDLNEMAYSNHGGKQFDFKDWLAPIIQL